MEINKLAQHILEYESDTFNGKNVCLTETELSQMLNKMYDYFIDNEINGVYLTQLILEVREENDALSESSEVKE